MKRVTFLLLLFMFPFFNSFSQGDLLTVAERSEFRSTSRYSDVSDFISRLLKTSSHLRVENIAVSAEGLEIPLLIIADPMPASPADLVNDKRAVVYIQANIHAGEVEGKEASLMFARDVLKNGSPAFLRDIVLLICPIFNPDGNEQISTKNRTNQNGPENGVGVRHNGMYLDLNRDAMKAESPEVKGLLSNVFNKWDPDVFMDCHTTNGSYHVEPVTFTWMVNPGGDRALINYMRDRMAPAVSKDLLAKHKVENCFYGEFINMAEPEKGWIFEASEPRYMTNYYGLRNRLAILNENYVYADFRSRVMGNYWLMHSLVDYVAANRSEIRKLLDEADRRTIARGLAPAVTDSFGIAYKPVPAPYPVTIRTWEVDIITGENGRRSYRKSDRQKDVTVPYLVDFIPTANVRFPYAYILTVKDPYVISVLRQHGIEIEKLSSGTSVEASRFEISELKGSARPNQGHYTNSIKGTWKNETITLAPGTLVIRTSQKLANVAAYMLEPQTNDGLLYWNFFDRYLAPQWGMGFYPYPVLKVNEKCILESSAF